jgi:hypothetical protein
MMPPRMSWYFRDRTGFSGRKSVAAAALPATSSDLRNLPMKALLPD